MSSPTATAPHCQCPASTCWAGCSSRGRRIATGCRSHTVAAAPRCRPGGHRAGTDDSFADSCRTALTEAGVEYSLLGWCLWSREPIGWLTHTRVWAHLHSGRLPRIDKAGGWATADARRDPPGTVDGRHRHQCHARRPHPLTVHRSRKA